MECYQYTFGGVGTVLHPLSLSFSQASLCRPSAPMGRWRKLSVPRLYLKKVWWHNTWPPVGMASFIHISPQTPLAGWKPDTKLTEAKKLIHGHLADLRVARISTECIFHSTSKALWAVTSFVLVLGGTGAGGSFRARAYWFQHRASYRMIFKVCSHAVTFVVSADSKGEAGLIEYNWRCQERLLNNFRVVLYSSGNALGGSFAYEPGMMEVQLDANS